MSIIFDGEQAVAGIVDDPDCHFLPAPAFTVRDGFQVSYNLGNSLFSCARDEAVRQHPVPGRLWHWFPKSGRFHIGFVLIDDLDRTFSFDVHIQKQFRFRVTTSRADGLRHIYFTEEAYEVAYAQTVELRFDGDGSRQGVEGLVFLAEPPAERLARMTPPPIRREARRVENAPLSRMNLVNPGSFSLSHELLCLPLPAPWEAGTALRLGRRRLPYCLAAPKLAEVLVDGISSPTRTIHVEPGREEPVMPGLTVTESENEVLVRDARRSWRISLHGEGFRVSTGERSWRMTPLLEAEGTQRSARLTVIRRSELSICIEAAFEIAGFLHATRLRLVAGSPRVEMEHLLENHGAGPFSWLRRHGLRLEVDDGEEPRAIGDDGATSPVTDFRGCWHTERDSEMSVAAMPHSLQWAGTQVTMQEMRFSAPIAMTASRHMLDMELLPPADSVRLDPDEEYRLRNQFFIEDGRYKLREGMARRHFSCMTVEAPTDPAAVLYEAGRLDDPPFLHASLHMDGLTAVVDPAFGRRALYRRTLATWLSLYLQNRDAVGAYGFFGYGDWFGERVSNWGNSEYDTPYAFLQHFMVTGDPELRRLGLAAARHQMDVDTYHGEHPKGGWQITHSMAHGGRYFPDEFRVGAYSHGGIGIAHNWVEGMLLYGRLTGDPRAEQVARRLLDDLAGPCLKNWGFTNGREAGWHLIHLCAGYRELADVRYLEAAAELVEKILARQRRDGSFRRVLYSDHCLCYPKHTGEVSFMMGILLDGLKRFHALTGDPAVEEAIVSLARCVIEDMWDVEGEFFRYTSCPASKMIESAMMLEGLSYAARLSDDRKLLARWRKDLKRMTEKPMDPRIVAGELVYGDGACGKVLSQRLRMFADCCHELL